MSERGFALVTVVLLMIGLAVLATALALSASQQVAVRASLHDLARARVAAHAGVEAEVAAWSSAERALDPIGTSIGRRAVDFDPGVRIDISTTRLRGSSWLVEARATVARGALTPVVREAQRIVRGVDVDSIGHAIDAAVIASSVEIDGMARVAGSSSDRETDDLCARWPDQGAALRAPPESTFVSAAAELAGSPLTHPDPDPARFRTRVGVLDRAALEAVATRFAGAEVTPAPVLAGLACDTTAAANWGAPAGECSDRHVLIHADGPLTIRGGFGQGILLVAGDLVLDDGFVFQGLILALGTVTVRSAEIRGSIAAARVRVESPGRVELDRCAVGRALSRVPAIRAAVIPVRSWLPTFD